jgi:hypothetical protein
MIIKKGPVKRCIGGGACAIMMAIKFSIVLWVKGVRMRSVAHLWCMYMFSALAASVMDGVDIWLMHNFSIDFVVLCCDFQSLQWQNEKGLEMLCVPELICYRYMVCLDTFHERRKITSYITILYNIPNMQPLHCTFSEEEIMVSTRKSRRPSVILVFSKLL